jgi:hypothetical protein
MTTTPPTPPSISHRAIHPIHRIAFPDAERVRYDTPIAVAVLPLVPSPFLADKKSEKCAAAAAETEAEVEVVEATFFPSGLPSHPHPLSH